MRPSIALAIICLSFTARPLDAAAQSLDLSKYKRVFAEDFKKPSISANGPGTTWIAHTPWNGDFGDAQFVDPTPTFPFGRAGGKFRIEMRRNAQGRWQSGLLSSVDRNGKGFALQYGYFEIRTKLPAGPGVWPAFWLNSVPSADSSIEVDILEHYGKFPGAFNSVVHTWTKDPALKPEAPMHIQEVRPGTLSKTFHRYGAEVRADWTIIYFDRKEIWRTPTPPDHKHPLMILADLALGGGWPIEGAPDPAYMEIDYIRAYAPR